METDRRLHWAMANRTPHSDVPPIGRMVDALVNGAWRRDSELRAGLASMVSDCVDQEFLRHCRLGELHNGMLVIEVDEPGLISILRARWASKIESAFRKCGAKTGVRRVLFKFGRSGDRIPVKVSRMSDKHG